MANLKITNPLGITVYKTQDVTEHTLQLQNSASGMFFVVIVLKDGNMLTQKMMVQR
ncbi:MAG: T9SS type A sorting domain-containing protein [Bacteroidetes bacterium]|nr:T9SS type A sorting domain-containing protein [Bacteroidota bacterium]MCL1969221.1 T9SS type A sorting domain-containing protein [Bacteroidota bacterium]